VSETDAEAADVLQGRLGWEDGDISEAKPEELETHPKNAEIYGDTDDISDVGDAFVESVREKGVLEPLVVTDGKQIISGHRRWLAAQEVGVETVPIRKSSFDNDLAEREALIEFNRQREKTPGQIVNEFEEMLEIERQRAKEREKKGGEVGGKGSGNVTKPFHRAKKNVEKADAESAVKDQRDTDTTQPTVHNADALSFMQSVDEQVDLLLTDPPYSTDIDDVTAFARSWVPDALNTVATDGFAFIFVGAYPDELQAYLNVIGDMTPWSVCQVLVWTYRNTLGRAPNDRYKLNWQAILYLRGPDASELDTPKTSEQWAVQDINAPDGRHEERHHKWEKPTELADRLVRHTTTENDTVIDPFAGTGTFALTAAKLNRDVIACDNDSEMLDIASDRGCVIDE